MTFMALLLTYLLDDFLLQPEWIKRKKSNRFWPLICSGVTHLIITWACLLVFTQVPFLSIQSQAVITGYIAFHLLIGDVKFRLIARKTQANNWKTFLFYQSLQVIVLAITAFILTGNHLAEFFQSIQLSTTTKADILEVMIIYISVVFGGGYLIRYLTKGLAKNIVVEASSHMENAGLYVGWIERLLVITAIAIQSPALVGLILTGKSIVRFPEFKEARFAEYFLIGTLLSISLSVFGGIVLLQLLYGSVSLK
jgi:hypothetical protein